MSWSQELIGGGSGIGKELVSGVVAIAGLGGVAMKSIVKVPKNHRGIPTVRANPERTRGSRKGQRYQPVGSGLHFVVPFIGGIESRSMQKQPEGLQALSVKCLDGKYNADASIIWHVKQSPKGIIETKVSTEATTPTSLKSTIYGAAGRGWIKYFAQLEGVHIGEPTYQPNADDENLYRSLFEIEKDKLNNIVKNFASAGIVAAAQNLTSDRLLEPNIALPKTQELYGDAFDSYGVELDGIYITSFGPSEAQVQADVIREVWGSGPDKDTKNLELPDGPIDPPVHLHVVLDGPSTA